MKLATFSTAENPTPRLGVVRGDGMVDVSTIAGAPDSMAAYLSGGQAADEQVRSAAATVSQAIALDAIDWHPPVPGPGKMLGIGLNYADHIAETGMKKPEVQMWFNKQHNCVNGPYADINLPAVSDKLDYEAELCVVIGRRCKHVPRERAHEVIAGYCCGNDVSVRDWQRSAITMQIGKSFDTHGPIGPYLVTPDEVGDPHNLDIRALVNGEVRQSSNTRHLIFDCYDAVAHLTRAFVLDPGDVLFTGTPAGVGNAMKPPCFLKAGDVVRIEIEKLGHLEARVARERAECVIQ
ncbi:MAG: fumarylacetoacetate hydrolase family protein [Gammaproteobacteria bacterium]|nr:fumarylacetoacetate hydrolase family protein [Gammaproteobacteria bacterium]MDE0367791.1 fumarylacetoacetate hydrolase family protein [Gammaproteobacteria bacterium]